MKIGFLEPAFLTALILVAVPIIVHLFNFRKFKVVYFTNVSFLKELKEETNSRSKLKHLLVLASRILAVVFLVLAFAQPIIPTATGKKAFSGNIVSIYVDNSFSMEALGTKGARLEEATGIARDIAKSYKPSDRFQLLTADFDPTHQRLMSREEFLTAIDQVEPSSSTRTVSEVLSRQSDIIKTGGTGNKVAIQISDFQQSITDLTTIRSDSNLNVLLVPLAASETDNISLDSCWLMSPVTQKSQITEIGVRVRNHGTTEISAVPLKLTINGSQKSAASVDLAAGGFQDITLSFTPADTGWYACMVSLEDNSVLFDDRYFFSFHVADAVPVVSINGPNGGAFFKSLFPIDGFLKYSEFTDKQIDYGAVSAAQVVILNEVRQPTTGLISEMEKFVNRGGTLVVVPDSVMDRQSYANLSASLNTGVFGGLSVTQDKLDKLQLEDPVFEGVFTSKSGIGSSTDLPGVNAFFPISGGVPEILIRLRSGEGYLSRYRSGNGTVYLLGSALSGRMTGLARHAVFVPIFYRICLLSTNPQISSLKIGRDPNLELPSFGITGDRVFKLKGGSKGVELIPSHRMVGASVKVGFGNTVKESGHYDLSMDGLLLAKPAFNYNRAESHMKFYDADQLKQQVTEARLDNFKIDANFGAIAMAGNKESTGVPLWKYCIILALIFLTIEILLLKFWKA